MPNRDGTGPFGDGRLGKGFGPCGRIESGLGRNCGRGNRFRGRNGFGVNSVSAAEADSQEIYAYTRSNMEAQKAELEKQLNWLNAQLNAKKED